MLQHGSTIGVLTTSDALSERRAGIVARGCAELERQGFRVVKGSTLQPRSAISAGSPSERADELMAMLRDQRIDALLFAWGGETTSQILDHLDFDEIARHPKILLGHSDYTVLMNAFASTGMRSFYWHFAASLDPAWEWFGDYDRETFAAVLLRGARPFTIPASAPRETYREGAAEGVLLGGCITDLIKLVGTPYLPDLSGCILMLESYELRPAELVAHLRHLRQAGVFDSIAGLLLGNFMVEGPLDGIFRDELADFSFPILKTKDFGHNSHMAPLPIGGKASMDATRKTLVLLD